MDGVGIMSGTKIPSRATRRDILEAVRAEDVNGELDGTDRDVYSRLLTRVGVYLARAENTTGREYNVQIAFRCVHKPTKH